MAYTNIDDPSAYFQALTYTGNGTTTNNVTNTGNSNLQPDLVWIKQRSATKDHVLTDSNRDGEVDSGTNIVLTPNETEVEASSTGFGINYATNGINFDASWDKVNANNQTYVAWQWKANGGTTASNSNGSITSTVQANTDAGFSIVTYTGTGSAATVGHGLGVVPSVMIIKNREYAASWVVYHKDIHADAEEYGLRLNNTTARASTAGFWNNTAPTSSVFTIGDNSGVNNGDNTDTLVAYCFAEKQGYSKFSSYVGNGNANGAFIHTGFKPAMVITKKSSTTGNWTIYDNKRDPFNVADTVLLPNTTNADQTVINFDFVSNGFKCRNSGSENESGTTYIYMAFAENPFVTSTGIPTTAR